jgi:hypothetical protein
MRSLSSQARLFALAEHDEALAMQLLAKLGAPPVQTFAAHSSERVTPVCLRAALTGLLDPHIPSQRDYHLGKAAKRQSLPKFIIISMDYRRDCFSWRWFPSPFIWR